MHPSHEDVRRLVNENPGQGTFEEYAHVLDTILQRAPAKLLVFGVGKDSALWLKANRGGRTVFVEHEAEWVARTRSLLPDAEVVQVRYWTRRWQWPFLLAAGGLLHMRDLPQHVLAERWDIIFVDSPQGGNRSRPGRMQSLYTASRLARRSRQADVLAHDCDRVVERAYCDHYLKRHGSLLGVTRSLRHYRIGAS